MKIKKTVMAGLIGVMLSMNGMAVAGGGATGGALEPTQLMNHAELLASYAEQANQTITQVNQYVTMLRQLERLPQQQLDRALAKMTINGLPELRRLISTSAQLGTSLNNVYKKADTLHKNALLAYEYADVSGSNRLSVDGYLQQLAQLSREKGGAHKARYEQLKTSVDTIDDDIEDINEIAASAPTIVSSVGGLQAIVQSNSIIAKQLVAMRTSMTQAEMNKSQQAMEYERNKEAQLEKERKMRVMRDSALYGAPK